MRFFLMSLLALSLASSTVSAQRAAPIGIEGPDTFSFRGPTAASAALPHADLGLHRQPRWVKAAVIGGVSGGVLFAAMHAMSGDWNPRRNSMAHDVAIGVLGGAAVAGGSFAFYDWVCAPGSASENAGLCGHQRAYVLRSGGYTSVKPVQPYQ